MATSAHDLLGGPVRPWARGRRPPAGRSTACRGTTRARSTGCRPSSAARGARTDRGARRPGSASVMRRRELPISRRRRSGGGGRRAVSSKSVRVWAPRLSSRARAAAHSRRPDGGQVAQLPRAEVVAGDLPGARAAPPRRATRPSGARRRARSSCAAASSRLGHDGRVGRRHARAAGRRCRRRRAATAWRPVALGPVDAPVDRLDDPRAEHHAVEQRVRRQAVGALHAVAARLAGHPQAGQRRRAVEVGDDAAAAVVRGRRDRQPVAWRGRARPRRAPRRSSGTARRSARGRWRRATGARRPARACGR